MLDRVPDGPGRPNVDARTRSGALETHEGHRRPFRWARGELGLALGRKCLTLCLRRLLACLLPRKAFFLGLAFALGEGLALRFCRLRRRLLLRFGRLSSSLPLRFYRLPSLLPLCFCRLGVCLPLLFRGLGGFLPLRLGCLARFLRTRNALLFGLAPLFGGGSALGALGFGFCLLTRKTLFLRLALLLRGDLSFRFLRLCAALLFGQSVLLGLALSLFFGEALLLRLLLPRLLAS